MNLTEKILKAHLVRGEMAAGREIVLRIDQTLTQDALGMLAYLAFETLNIPRVRTELSVSYLDHNISYLDFKNPDDHTYLRSMAKRYGLVLSRAGNGICHLLHSSRFAIPGKTIIGCDSHTPTCGAVGMLGIGTGGLDVAAAMAGIPLSLKMPEVINIVLNGRLKPGICAKDLALAIVNRVGLKGGKDRVLEYSGSGLEFLDIPERMTIANMATETGATSALFPSDAMTLDFFRKQKREGDFRPLAADAGATYTETIEFDLTTVRPMVATPHQPDNAVPVEFLDRVGVDQVYIGSCTNSSYSDLHIAAKILEGHIVPETVSLVISPGSMQNAQMLIESGAMETFILSGARILECACGPCVGMGQAVRSGGVSLRTSNRNFQGRCARKRLRRRAAGGRPGSELICWVPHFLSPSFPSS